jgi:hypothetical protein
MKHAKMRSVVFSALLLTLGFTTTTFAAEPPPAGDNAASPPGVTDREIEVPAAVFAKSIGDLSTGVAAATTEMNSLQESVDAYKKAIKDHAPPKDVVALLRKAKAAQERAEDRMGELLDQYHATVDNAYGQLDRMSGIAKAKADRREGIKAEKLAGFDTRLDGYARELASPATTAERAKFLRSQFAASLANKKLTEMRLGAAATPIPGLDAAARERLLAQLIGAGDLIAARQRDVVAAGLTIDDEAEAFAFASNLGQIAGAIDQLATVTQGGQPIVPSDGAGAAQATRKGERQLAEVMGKLPPTQAANKVVSDADVDADLARRIAAVRGAAPATQPAARQTADSRSR